RKDLSESWQSRLGNTLARHFSIKLKQLQCLSSDKLTVAMASNLLVKFVSVITLLFCGILIGRWFFPVSDIHVYNSHDKIRHETLGESGIPCIVHQTWKSHRLLSARAQRWRNSWARCLPDCKHMFWTDEDNRRHIGMHFPWLLPTYECLNSGLQKSDLAKYTYLLHYGGIYAGIDTVCLRDFRNLLSKSALVFANMDGRWLRSVNGSYVQNSLMASRPEHRFWMALLKRIVAKRRRNKAVGSTPPEQTTGSVVLMEELQQYLDDGRTDVRVFPSRYFNPFSWITAGNQGNPKAASCQTMGNMNEDQEAACVAAFPEAYVVHMHSKSWGGGKL
ncbi:hypothetical protein BOX15_Mlig008270g1, partial [Macrostomum lignano]